MATQPCPCGNHGNPFQECICQPLQLQKYVGRISGPLLDRIDIHVEVPAVRFSDLASKRPGEPSRLIRDRVIKAREIQSKRFSSLERVYCNAHMNSHEIKEFCRIDENGLEMLKSAMMKLSLSARAFDRILKVSRTIADLAGSEEVRLEHIGEAIQYRSLDRNLLSH